MGDINISKLPIIFDRKWTRGLATSATCIKLTALFGLFLLLSFGFLFVNSVSGQTVVRNGEAESELSSFLESYCHDCHSSDDPKGDVLLSREKGLLNGAESQLLEKIVYVLEKGKMPPEDVDQPDSAKTKAILDLIDLELKNRIRDSSQEEIIPGVRRLTNLEYQNTMRDLLGIELEFLDQLSKDPVKPYQFNNTAELMRLGPEQVNRYLECARRAMKSVIVDPEQPEIHKSRREWKAHGVDRGLGGDELGVWGNRRNTPSSGMGLKSFPSSGEFRIRAHVAAILPEGISEVPLRLVMGYGLGVNSSTLQVEPVGTVRLNNTPDQMKTIEFRGRIENFPPQPGKIVNGKKRPDSMVITPQNLYDDGTLNDGQRQLAMPRIVIKWMEFEAPVFDSWPPEHHKRILFDSPLRKTDRKEYMRKVLDRFMTRAYRRPVRPDEVDRFVQIFELVSTQVDSFEEAVRETLSMVLVSPQFLYHAPVNKSSAVKRTKVSSQGISASNYGLASRLSYFLLGSMPDAELLELASSGELGDQENIKRQVLRMLADPRSEDSVRSFVMQWLSLSKMKTVPINRELFPRFLYYVSAGERAGTEQPYRPTIRDYMLEETVGFFRELIRNDAKVDNLVHSDFAWLNQPLANHYGVSIGSDGKTIQGNHFRRVAVTPNDHLGGLLTHGSFLVGNSTGSAPHPIYRAVWLREAILGDEVADPPADVPALSDSAGDSAEKALTIKDLLRKHRQSESCNSCHADLDPWGIPFERYNAIGRFQPVVPKEGTRVSGFQAAKHKDLAGYLKYLDSLNKVAIDASIKLPRGPKVEGLKPLKNYLIDEKLDEIAENLIRRLLTYGMGRELTYADRDEVKSILSQSKENGFRIRDMIVRVCQSDVFCGRMPKGE